MVEKVAIKNCKLLKDDKPITTNIYIEDGVIRHIGRLIDCNNIIDAENNFLLPGIIDPHVHFRTPGGEHKGDFKTESRAALAGGVTTVLDMPNNSPSITTIKELDKKRKLVSKLSSVNYGFHFGASNSNLKEIKKVNDVASVKVFMGSSTGDLLVTDEDKLKEIFANFPMISVHAEDEDMIRMNSSIYSMNHDPLIHSLIRPAEAAAKTVGKAILLSRSNSLYITHCSTKKELDVISFARKNNQKVYCEATPHHLFLTNEKLASLGNFAKMNPPLRSEEDRRALWHALRQGTIDCIGTDHAPHTKEEKEKTYWDAPSGVPGVETMLPLMLDAVNNKILSLQSLVRLTSRNPASIFNIHGKGIIKPGYDADFTIVDMKKEWLIHEKGLHYKCRWSPYHGMKVKGKVMKTIIAGNLVYDDGDFDEDFRGKEVTFNA